MSSESTPGRGLVTAAILIAVGAAAAVWLPKWWENRLYRQAEHLTGVGSPVLAGSVSDARKKIDNGLSLEKTSAAIGRPSFAMHTDGSSSHDIWIYYYADGTMTINLTDGVIQRIALEFGPPKIPTSRRP
jgi:hypothetical protein